MKALYRRPYRVSPGGLVLAAVISISGLLLVENVLRARRLACHAEMVTASELAAECMQTVKDERIRRDLPVDATFDPSRSGLIGAWMTQVTSTYGSLEAKQTSINPNFAAVVVRLLNEAGVEEGDTVTVGFSGSFPALNICVCAAIETLKLRPIIISTLSASQWGANNPGFLWIDMETSLRKRGLIDCRSDAVSTGGRDDRGGGMPEDGLALLKSAAERNEVPFIHASTFVETVEQRLAIYRERAGSSRIAAYINVGGAIASVGTPADKRAFRPGLNRRPPIDGTTLDSVMSRFADSGVPVIHLSQMEVLAREYGLPTRPTELPKPGEGQVYGPRLYSRPLAGTVLAVIFGVLFLLAVVARRRAKAENATTA